MGQKNNLRVTKKRNTMSTSLGMLIERYPPRPPRAYSRCPTPLANDIRPGRRRVVPGEPPNPGVVVPVAAALRPSVAGTSAQAGSRCCCGHRGQTLQRIGRRPVE